VKILLLGKSGQVGWELQRSLAVLGEVLSPGRSDELCGDLSNPIGLAETVRVAKPDVIVNAAAYTAVDQAESDPESAHAINAVGPGALALEAARSGALLIHYSTDYVFDGSGDQPWGEDDETAPLNVYGRTKREGEVAIRKSGCRHAIFRTSWVYASRGKNFARTILKFARERERLTVVDDQFGVPTGADLIADVTAHSIRSWTEGRDGIYHLVPDGVTTWHGYAEMLCSFARSHGADLKVREIQPVPGSTFKTPAVRPSNSRLNNTKCQATFGLHFPDWRPGVERMLAEIL
jgi:dTDP-4-dehydrorhamnose reductase